MRPSTSLLTWFDQNKRDLPWRRDRDPYRVLVSEVMLQQTRVETVLRYYEPFLESFPSVEVLARTPVDDVLVKWSGLGYYSRARRLHAAARAIVELGRFPSSASELLLLPGIGAYTASAVASIAFGEVIPVLDGNVERVVGRYIALDEDPKRKHGRQALLEKAGELLSSARAGDSNQALMELGATLCSPTRPQCLLCPLADGCRGFQAGAPESFPPKRERRRSENRSRLVAVVVDASKRKLLVRRSEDEGWMPGLWELPFLELEAALSRRSEQRHRDELDQLERGLSEKYGGSWSIAATRATVRHGITHYRFSLEVRRCDVHYAPDQVRDSMTPELRWCSDREIGSMATTSMVEKSLRAIEVPARS
jgi:A/G-specific adenine glycosylase